MSEGNGDAGPVEVEINVGAEAAGGSGDGGEVAEVAAVETAAEASVEIAQIEADARVAVAAIEADASIYHHELSVEENRQFAETLANSELEECRTELADLRERFTAQTMELEQLKAQLTPPPSEEPPPSQSVEVEEAESVVVVPPEAVTEQAPEPEKAKRKKARWI